MADKHPTETALQESPNLNSKAVLTDGTIPMFVRMSNETFWSTNICFALKAQQVQLSTSDPDGDAVRVEWVIMAESTANSTGGDAEVVPPSYPNATVNPSNSGLTIPGNVLPPGPYRVFIYVRDGKGAAATANLPFNIE